MGGKFSTTSSALFTNQNKISIPDWMTGLEDIQPEKQEQIRLDFDKLGAFATSKKVSRDNRDYHAREITASYNNNQLILEGKIELSKFLAGRYYNVEAKAANNIVILSAKLTNVPCEFNFTYKNNNGRLSKAQTFNINTGKEIGEYPFSIAGLEECLADIKNGTVKTAMKAESYTASTITLEEIVRRFNGDTRQAIDTARALVKSGDIIGVSSNTFATVYDIDSLFPQLEKEPMPEKKANVEFINNIEHTATNAYTSAPVLAIDASKTLAEFFDDFMIKSSVRDKNELLVNADVLLSTGEQKNIDFNFGILNDKVASLKCCEIDNQRYTLEQVLNNIGKSNVLDEYLKKNHKSAKRIYRGIVITAKEFNHKLAQIVSKENVGKIINNLVERNIIIPINSTTFTSNTSFENLLNEVNTKLLTASEVDNMKAYMRKFASAEVDRLKQKDTGIRNDKELEYSAQIRLANAYNCLATKLNNFNIAAYSDDCTNIHIINKDETGISHLSVTASYKDNKLTKLHISKLNDSKAVKLYNQTFAGKKIFAKAVFSKAQLQKALASVFKEKQIDTVINMITNNRAFNLKEIGTDVYASEEPISAIISKVERFKYASLLSDKDRKEINAVKAYFGKKITGENVSDTGIRNDKELEYSTQIRLANVYNKLASKLNDFNVDSYSKDCTKLDIIHKDASGISKLFVTASFDMNNVKDIHIKASALSNDSYKAYNEEFSGKKIFAKAVFSKTNLQDILSRVFSIKNIDSLLHTITADASFNIKEIGTDIYASDEPIASIMTKLEQKKYANLLTKNEKTAILTAKKKQAAFIEREDVDDTGIRDIEITDTEAGMLNKVNAMLSKIFNSFTMSDIHFDGETLTYGVNIFDENTGLQTRINLYCTTKDDKLDCKAILDGKEIALKNVVAAFKTTDVLKNYLSTHTGKKTNAPIIISAQKLVRELQLSTNISDETLEKCILNWHKMGKIQRIGNNSFVSKFTLEELLAMSNLQPLSEEEYNRRMAKSLRNKLMKLSSNYVNDNDTRTIDKDWDENRIIAHINKDIQRQFNIYKLKDVDTYKDKIIATANIDNNGYREDAYFTYQIQDGKLTTSSVSLNKPEDKAMNTISEMHKQRKAEKIVISGLQLKEKLMPVIDVNYYDTIVKTLINHGIIKSAGKNFVSVYSIPEIVSKLSALHLTNVEAGRDALSKANIQKMKFDLDKKQLDDNSRRLEAKEDSLNGQLKIAGKKLIDNIHLAYNEKFITTRKHDELIRKAENVKAAVDLESVCKELKKYLV